MSNKIQNNFYLLKDSINVYSKKLLKNISQVVDGACIRKQERGK